MNDLSERGLSDKQIREAETRFVTAVFVQIGKLLGKRDQNDTSIMREGA